MSKSDLDKNFDVISVNETAVDYNQLPAMSKKRSSNIMTITVILILSGLCMVTFTGVFIILKRSQLEYDLQNNGEITKEQYEQNMAAFESHPTFLQLIQRSTTQIEEPVENCAENKLNDCLSEMGEILNEIQSFRIKRELNNAFDYDQATYEKLLREKRFSEIQLQRKKDEFSKCKANENDYKTCEPYYDEFKKIADDIGKKFGKMMKLLNEISEGKVQYHGMTSSEEAKEVTVPETGEKFTVFIKSYKKKNKDANHEVQPATTCAAHTSPHTTTSSSNVVTNTTSTVKPPTSTTSTMVATTIPTIETTPVFKKSSYIETTEIKTTTETYINTTSPKYLNTTTELPMSTLTINTTEAPTFRINDDEMLPDLPTNTVKKGEATIDEDALDILSNFDILPPTYHNPVHEDLIDNLDNSQHRSMDSPKLYLHERFNTYRQHNNAQTNPSQKTFKDMDMVGASGPFLTLCDQLLKQVQAKDKITTLNNNNNQQPIFVGPQMQPVQHQFTSRGLNNQPMTGDSIKGTAQIMVNPGFSYVPYPMCFVLAPMNHQLPNQNRNYQYGFPAYQMAHMQYGEKNTQASHTQNSGGPVKFDIDPRFGGYVVVPTQLQSITTSSGFQVNHQIGRSSESAMHPNQQFFCSYLPSNSNTNMEHQNLRSSVPEDSQTDIIYASYGNHLHFLGNGTMSNFQNYCMDNEYPCSATNQCVPKEKWCDSTVDCLDASDETSCSCKSRLAKTKICDGYLDCPMGDDEIGCFGCDKFSYSCYKSETEYKAAKMSTLSMCYTILEKCDGYQNCLNGYDEAECTMISKSVGHHLSYMVSYTEGFLHRNYKGKWYPVCHNPMQWARETCMREMSTTNIPDPQMFYKSSEMQGPFIDFNVNLGNLTFEPSYTDECTNQNGENAIAYIKCPTMDCGIGTVEPTENSIYHDETQVNRIVGGHIADPMAWPFAIAIYQNGSFHCGGVIYSEMWILSAAHCFAKARNSHYEIRAGMNRRLSYSPMVQVTVANKIYVHEDYDKNAMSNDLALIKLVMPLIFNKWVQPICMPAPNRTTLTDDWIWGPQGGSICTTVGWGSIREKGMDSDHLREVSIPIISQCKHKKDQESEGICAGDLEGGHDACQGDSGGPLFCKSLNMPLQNYLAGIVSHGEGCGRANEPGVYTRVALFLDWINDCTENHRQPTYLPLVYCPGKVCVWGGGYCLSPDYICDRIVDCLGGEDEIDCRYEDSMLGVSQNITIPDEKENYIALEDERPIETQKFKCTKIAQNINAELRCNYEIDCEDGSDEENCTCSEYLHNISPQYICDGVLECRDGTDEMNCVKCSDDEFLCERSQKCIKKYLQCDQVIDCPLKEDEMDCHVLTDGTTINFDLALRPISSHYGFVTVNTNGTWNILCLSEDDINRDILFDSAQATKLCHQFGYSDYEIFNLTQIDRSPSSHSQFNSSLVDEEKSIEVGSSTTHNCMSLYLKCIPNFMMNLTKIEDFIKINMKHFRNYESFDKYEMSLQPGKYPNVVLQEHQKKRSTLSEILYNFPWNSEIFVDGKLFCNGVLIGRQWILSENICMGLINLKLDYVEVLIGGGLAEKHLEGPHEQIRRVDCLKNVDGSNLILLHMDKAIEYSRYSIPMHIPKIKDNERESNHTEDCLAISFNNHGRMKSMPVVQINGKQCSGNVVCFEAKANETCDEEESLSAIVLCQHSDIWYPKSIYSHRRGLCAFKKTVRLIPFMMFYDQMFEISNSTGCSNTNKPLVCRGHRCPLGKCLEKTSICDGKIDCRDRSDEDKNLCSSITESSCNYNEFKCGNGNCVAKQLFCNQKDDCGDRTDEPKECSCFSFLNATDSGKICDGIRNCYDKSDEPKTCQCQKNSYRCGSTKDCIPMEYVCDGEFDCPAHEDENYCTGLLQNHNSDDFHEIMQQSYGVWHTQCFPKSTYLNITDMEDICQRLGSDIKPISDDSVELRQGDLYPQYRIIDSSILQSTQNGTIQQKFTDATKVIIVNHLAALKLSKDFIIFMKPSRPFAKLINWSHEDKEKCYRIEIRCQ